MRLSLRSFLRYRPGTTNPRRRVAPRSRPLLESLECRTVPSIMFSGPNNSGVATITGTAKPDQFAIQLNPTDATMIELSDNGGASFTDAALSGITSIVVDGLQGRDTLTLNEGNGLVALAAGLPITFNGGPGRDALIVEGSPSGTIKETFTPGTTAGSSTLDITDGTLSSTVTLSSVARIR
ncbi:MAG TPA: hypothetical protein VGY66_19225, partial [Gemmataceae bacterium]|nr:hypothetical protein [Gemmataceae bacterium]